jgi:hypothetical protein
MLDHVERIERGRGPFCNLVLTVVAGKLCYHLGAASESDPGHPRILRIGSVDAPDGFGAACLERASLAKGHAADDLAFGLIVAFCAWSRDALGDPRSKAMDAPGRIAYIRHLVHTRLGRSDLSVHAAHRRIRQPASHVRTGCEW